jgi:hypothetical protein
MKKILSVGALLGLLACGGGGGGISTSGDSMPVPSSSGQADASVKPQKPFMNYLPYFLDVMKGNYTVECGSFTPPRTSAIVKISAAGFVTPWLGGSLDIRYGSLGFSRALKIPGDGSLTGGISTIGIGDDKSSPIFSITSDGDVGGTDFSRGVIAGNPLGVPESGVNGLTVPGSILACNGSAEAAKFVSLSVYTAFSKIIDAKKSPLNCIVPGGTVLFPETYEISNGELKFQGKTISLLTGFQSETFGSLGATARTSSSGVVEYIRNPTYLIKKVDGVEINLTYNEYGEMAILTHKDGIGGQVSCLLPT